MHKEGLICHASGDFSKSFIIGYYMYFILPQKKGMLKKKINRSHYTDYNLSIL